VQKQCGPLGIRRKRLDNSEIDFAPQVGLEQSRLFQPLSQIHIDFVTNIGKSKGFVTSPLQLTTSSEIAKIARIGKPAVQKQHIFRPSSPAGR
jgi:hypothetical protein